jgi:hypothetical protein
MATAVGVGAILGLTGTAAAVTAAAINGALIGAVVGAATAAVSGGSILKGALKGAAIGGVSAGFAKGFEISAAASMPTKATSATPGIGAGATTAAQTETSAALTGGPLTEGARTALPGTLEGTTGAASGIANVPTPAMASIPKSTGLLSGLSENTAKIYAGVGEGLFKGLGTVGAQIMKSEGDKELAEYQNKMSQNIPAKFQGQVANITVPESWKQNWWDKHLNVATYNKNGLLSGV